MLIGSRHLMAIRKIIICNIILYMDLCPLFSARDLSILDPSALYMEWAYPNDCSYTAIILSIGRQLSWILIFGNGSLIFLSN